MKPQTPQEQRAWLGQTFAPVVVKQIGVGLFETTPKSKGAIKISNGDVCWDASAMGKSADASLAAFFGDVTNHGKGRHIVVNKDGQESRLKVNPKTFDVRAASL